MTKSGKTYFTEPAVRRMKPPPAGQEDRFEKLRRGLTLVLRLSYGGTKAWRVLYYHDGKPHAKTLGHYPALGVAEARKAAFAFDPKAATSSAAAGSFKEVAEKWIKHYVDAKQLRSKDEIIWHLEKFIYPHWARKPFFEIRRKTVNELLDQIVENHSPGQADAVLATIRGITNWYAGRSDDEDYVSPIVKGMRRDQRKASDRARSRILTDDEIRQVWTAADPSGVFGAIIKLLLLTAQRREKVVTMKWSDIEGGVWTIATETREKGNAGKLVLPPMARDIIAAQSQIDDNPYVFAGSLRGRRFNSWSKRKHELDARLGKMPQWTLHDLRRSARSLLARAGVADNIAERVLGHAIAGVQGVYNRHNYIEEKADALARLAALIAQIINPPERTNVVSIGRRTSGEAKGASKTARR
jgi:integrase